MPFKKRNKKTYPKQNKIIKKRLMQISICIDNYIYKNKPITVEEAKMYAQEISVYKAQCCEDIPMLQVIDKLTRCMKSIAEGNTKNVIPNQNTPASDKGESIDVFLESSGNVYLKDTEMANNNKNRYDLTSNNVESNNIKPTKVYIVGCESDNKTNDVILNNDKQNYDLNKLISKCSGNEGELQDKSFETTDKNNNSQFKSIVEQVTTKNVLDKGNLKITSTEKRPLKSFETPISLLDKDHLRSDYKDIPDTHKLKIDKTATNIGISIQCINDKNNSTQKCLQTTKNDSKSIVSVEKNQQVHTTSLCHINAKNNTQKNRTKKSVKNAIKEINSSVQVKPTTEKKIKCVSKKSINKENITNMTRGRKKPNLIPGNNIINSITPKKLKHTNVHIKNDEVSITAWDEKSVKTISQVDSLTYNKCAENDLSWVENIKYVREVNENEFDLNLNGLKDNFWDDFSLPGGWSDVEFLY